MRSDADKVARAGRIGSQGIAALAGLSSWLRPIDVYRAAVDGWDPEPSELMEIGELLEPVILTLYARRTGREVVKVGQLCPEDFPFLVSTPDGLGIGDGGQVAIEAKSANGWATDGWGSAGTDEVPPAYLAQTHWHMLAMRACGLMVDTCDVPVLLGGCKFALYSVRFDQALAESLLRIGREFYERHILPRVPPPVDDSPAYAAYLRDLYPMERAPLAPADGSVRDLAEQLRAAREAEKQAKEWKRGLENRIKAAVGEAEGVEGDGFRITWRANKAGKRTFRPQFFGEESSDVE